MTAAEALQQLINALVKRFPATVGIGKVKDVDKQNRTCTLERDEQPDLFKVRLNSVIDDYENYFTVFPKVGSYVLTLNIGGDATECYLLATSEVEEITLKIGSQSLKANKDGFVFNEGNFDGMVKINELTDKINSLVNSFNTHTHIVSTTGTAAAQSGTAAPVTAQAQTFNRSDYEDNKVKH